MGDKGERLWLKKEVYERFKELKPKGMTDNLFMTYLLNLYEREGREELERVWGLFSGSSAVNKRDRGQRVSVPDTDTGSEADLEGWDV